MRNVLFFEVSSTTRAYYRLERIPESSAKKETVFFSPKLIVDGAHRVICEGWQGGGCA